MKRYIKGLLAISVLFLLLISSLIGLRLYVASSLDWHLPKEKHILFMGASHVEKGFCDSLSREAVNVAKSSERYMYTYMKLKRYLKVNPQIDTIFLQCSSTDLWEDTDVKYHILNEQSFYVKHYWPLMGKDEWQVILLQPKQVLGVVTSGLTDKACYKRADFMKSISGYDGRDNSKKFVGDSLKPDYAVPGGYGFQVNYRYLRKIIELCNTHDIKLYLMYYPVFKPEYTYGQQFCDSMRRTYFSDVEYLDYSHWNADDSERLDAHHLNHKGSVRFTEELMERFGFK